MAGPGRRGPAPKDPSIRQRTNADGRDWRYYPDVPFDGEIPELPESVDHPNAIAWWTATSTMPHCAEWSPSMWHRALTVAHLWCDWWRDYDEGKVSPSKTSAVLKAEVDLATTKPEQMKQGIVIVAADDPVEETPDVPTPGPGDEVDPRSFLRSVS